MIFATKMQTSVEYTFYEIRCRVTNEVYVGSAVNLANRMRKHRHSARKPKPDTAAVKILLRNEYDVNVLNKARLTSREACYMEEQTIIDNYRNAGEKLQNKINAYNGFDPVVYARQCKQRFNEKHKDTKNLKIACPCGGNFTLGSKRHESSKRHMFWIMECEENRQTMIEWAQVTPIFRAGNRFLNPVVDFNA
jgi:predicted GIY-YIG superfamily endonuclease